MENVQNNCTVNAISLKGSQGNLTKKFYAKYFFFQESTVNAISLESSQGNFTKKFLNYIFLFKNNFFLTKEYYDFKNS